MEQPAMFFLKKFVKSFDLKIKIEFCKKKFKSIVINKAFRDFPKFLEITNLRRKV